MRRFTVESGLTFCLNHRYKLNTQVARLAMKANRARFVAIYPFTECANTTPQACFKTANRLEASCCGIASTTTCLIHSQFSQSGLCSTTGEYRQPNQTPELRFKPTGDFDADNFRRRLQLQTCENHHLWSFHKYSQGQSRGQTPRPVSF
jgi:hypothetical protein